MPITTEVLVERFRILLVVTARRNRVTFRWWDAYRAGHHTRRVLNARGFNSAILRVDRAWNRKAS